MADANTETELPDVELDKAREALIQLLQPLAPFLPGGFLTDPPKNAVKALDDMAEAFAYMRLSSAESGMTAMAGAQIEVAKGVIDAMRMRSDALQKRLNPVYKAPAPEGAKEEPADETA